MKVEFLHISDVHLGYQQYGHRERFNDFARSFLAAIEYACEQEVEFVLISGDLFHKSAIDPPTLLQAVKILDMLREANIPAVVIAGNHDKARYRDTFSWLDFLADRGYLTLLCPEFSDNGLELHPSEDGEEAYIDIGCVRVFGILYLGASIGPVLAELPQKMAAIHEPKIAFSVLMAHAGIQGEMPRSSGGLTQNELAPLREQIDYFALGHLHKPFERGASAKSRSTQPRSRWGFRRHQILQPILLRKTSRAISDSPNRVRSMHASRHTRLTIFYGTRLKN